MCQTQIAFKHLQIEWRPAKNHITLCYLITIPINATREKILLSLMQRERCKVHAACGTIIKPPFVGEYIFTHPRRCTATDYHFQPFIRRSPRVPEIFKCFYETAFLCIHPRKFIKKNNNRFIASQRFKIFTQLGKRIKPILCAFPFVSRIEFQLTVKFTELFLSCTLIDTCEIKTKCIIEILTHQKGLTNSTTTINSYQFRIS